MACCLTAPSPNLNQCWLENISIQPNQLHRKFTSKSSRANVFIFNKKLWERKPPPRLVSVALYPRVKRNTIKIFGVRSRIMPDLSWKFHENRFIRFPAILLTDRQTDRQTNKQRWKQYLRRSAEVVIMPVICNNSCLSRPYLNWDMDDSTLWPWWATVKYFCSR